MKRKYIKTLAFGMALTCAVPAMAQNKVVQGTVLDDLGEPVIGATVKVAGTKTAVITDMDGNYKLSVPKGGKVTVSYIGFKDATTNGGTIKLVADDKTLQEVVVVGYGTQKKAHLTGSVANIPTDEIQDLANGGLASSLGGLVNGLSVSGGESRPGENARIMIRDTNSLGEVGSTAQQPLFVIDGYIYPNDVKVGNTTQNLGAEAFNNLDASEVESISVLKDASATAVYGVRGANGVILVTTKRGKDMKPEVSLTSNFMWGTPTRKPHYLNSYDSVTLLEEALKNDGLPSQYSASDIEMYRKSCAGELTGADALLYPNVDWYDEVLNNWAPSQRYNVSVRGGTKRMR